LIEAPTASHSLIANDIIILIVFVVVVVVFSIVVFLEAKTD